MKTKINLLLIILFLILTAQTLKADNQTSTKGTEVIDNEIFSVSGPSKRSQTQGVERDFTLAKKSKVTVALASNKQKPSLNVYLLDADNYSKYKTSGSLTNLDTVDSLSKKGTLGFNASAILPPGKYVFVIHWGADRGLFTTAPAVAFKLVSQAQADPAPKPTPTPTKKWYQF